jgi:hypothetical protein
MKSKLGKISLALTSLIMASVLVAAVIINAKADPLDTWHSSWHLVRETATEDGANFAAVYNLDANEGNFASMDSSSVANGGPFRITSAYVGRPSYEGQSPGAVWLFSICGGLSDNDTFSFDVVAWSKTNGPLQVICTGDGVIGTQDVVLYPDDSAAATNIWWADTLNLDATNRWPGVAVYNSGNNNIAMLAIDTTGIEYIQFVVYDADGSGTEANNLTVYGRRY